MIKQLSIVKTLVYLKYYKTFSGCQTLNTREKSLEIGISCPIFKIKYFEHVPTKTSLNTEVRELLTTVLMYVVQELVNC